MDPSPDEKICPRPKEVRDAILELLRSRSRKARFVTELYAALEKSKISTVDAERALAQLENDGAVIVRDHFCADPHLAGVDLRVATVVEHEHNRDPQLGAIQRIDQAWNKWLNEYLANHRCG